MGKPSAPFDEAGTGNGLTAGLVRHSHRKRGVTDRPSLRSTAPVLDPTALLCYVPRRLFGPIAASHEGQAKGLESFLLPGEGVRTIRKGFGNSRLLPR